MALIQENAKNKYPFVFVHGMFGWGANEGLNRLIPYWGASTGNLVEYLTDEDFDCYAASVGPLSSAWDQACELYAQLTGTQVDYGVYHSAVYGSNRFGRYYAKPLFDGWGKPGGVQKIHIIGHSFGGQAARMLTYLLTYGSKEERDACADCSPLFEGGHEDMIASCTAICSPMNGSTAFNAASSRHILHPLKGVASTWAATFGRSVLNGKLVDFHLESFGLSATPGESATQKYLHAIRRFYNTTNSVDGDLSIAGSKRINEMIEISPNVYYFSYAYDCTGEKNGKLAPTTVDFVLLSLFSRWIIEMGDFYDKASGMYVDDSWLPNDGLVNVVSALHPFDEPFKDYDPEAVGRGMWNVMPVSPGDHGTPIGLFSDKVKTHSFYNNLGDLLISIEKDT